MKSFLEFLKESGQTAGKMELVKTKMADAYAYAKEVFAKYGRDIDKELPNFAENYRIAKQKASTGKTVRKEMPVINDHQVKAFQARLKKGFIDVNTPLGDVTNPKNPFPEGLNGDSAQKFLEAGLKIHDGDKNDDKVKITTGNVAVKKLKPIQKQIYFDKSINMVGQFGVKDSTKFHTSQTYYLISKDLYIIDGHHRFMSAILMDPNMKVNVVMIDLPISKLLPASKAYGDAIGNKRNA